MKPHKKSTGFLNADFSNEDTLWLTSSVTLRKTIGVLGMLLPVLIYVFLFFDSGWWRPLDSISHYYYTRVSGIFIAVLSILGIFLIIYKGHDSVDLFVSLIAGVAALCVAFFPTNNLSDVCCNPSKVYCVTMLEPNHTRELFHFIAAGIFLLCLSYMSFFLFTKSDKHSHLGKQKLARNLIYRTCGVIMLLAMVVIACGSIMKWHFYKEYHMTFWMEALAVECFGFAWLVKGETLFKD